MSLAPLIPPGLEASLRSHDSRLRIMWNHVRNKWAICETGRMTGKMSLCFFWETPGGGYRPLPGTAEPILRKLADMDMTRFMGTPKQKMIQFSNELDAPRRRWLNERAEKWRNAEIERRDVLMRAAGKRTTVAATSPKRYMRSRKVGDGNLQSFLDEMQKTSMMPETPLPRA